MNHVHYFDHAAATPVDTAVLAAMQPYFSERFYNPSSPYAPAVEIRREYANAKARLAATFGGRADECIITAGATESINLAFTASKGHVVTSKIEHDAVLAAAKRTNATFVKPTEKGIVTADAIVDAVTEETDFVSIQLANNEIGTIQPIRDISVKLDEIRRTRSEQGNMTPLIFHCDASQGFGHIDVHTARLGVDLLTLNAGKMYGPKQTGLLWVKPGISLKPLIVGGGQELGLRSGTENVAATIGFAVAAERSLAKRKHEAARLQTLRDEMQEALQTAFPHMIVSGHQKKRLPGSLHVSFPGLDGERLLFGLEARGVMVATGSACAANKGTRSHVLTSLGMSDERCDGSVRITLGRLNDEVGCKEATKIIIETVQKEYERVGRA